MPLHLHRSTVAFLLWLASGLAACDSGGGAAERVTLRYVGDAPAYGVYIEGRADEAAAGAQANEAPTCTLSAAATTAGCRSTIVADAQKVRLTIDGCFVEAGDELFECELSPELAEALRSNATVSAGCGCEQCPASPAITVCTGGATDCEVAVAADAARSRPDIVKTSHQATGETTCSTCCETDFYEDEIGTVESEQPLSEIAFYVRFSEECQFDFNGAAECDLLNDVYDDWSVQEFLDGRLVKRFCFAGRDAADAALSVPLVSCRGNIEEITVTRALGPKFTPLASVPTIGFE